MWQDLFSPSIKTFHTRRKQRLKMIWSKLYEPVSLFHSLERSLERSFALNFIVAKFQKNNTLIYSHGRLNNVAWYNHLFWLKVQFLSIALVSCSVLFTVILTRLMSYINNRNKLPLMQVPGANYLKCHALLGALHFPVETTSLVYSWFL